MISPPLIVLDLGKIQTEIQKIEIVAYWLPQTVVTYPFLYHIPIPFPGFPSNLRGAFPAYTAQTPSGCGKPRMTDSKLVCDRSTMKTS